MVPGGSNSTGDTITGARGCNNQRLPTPHNPTASSAISLTFNVICAKVNEIRGKHMDKAIFWAGNATNWVRENPRTAILLAFAAVILALFL